MGIIKRFQLLILTVDRQCILCQVICSDTKEIHFFCKVTTYHDCCRCLDHNTKFNILAEINSFFPKFLLYFLNNLFDLLYFIYRYDHWEHDCNLTVSRCTIQRTELCLKNLLSCQADTNRTISKCRIFFFIQSEIIYLLVGSYIKRTDNDTFSCHIFRNLFVYLKLLFLSRESFTFQI